MPMNEEVRKALDRVQIICDTESEWADIPIADWHTLNNELTRLTEIADAVDPLVIRLGEVTTRLEAHTKMLADCFRMAGADPDGNEDWRIAQDALRAVTDLRRDYDEVLDWQDRAEKADALLRHVVAAHTGENVDGCDMRNADIDRITAHLGGEHE